MNEQSLTREEKQQIIADIEAGRCLAHIAAAYQLPWRYIQKLDDQYERYGRRALFKHGEMDDQS